MLFEVSLTVYGQWCVACNSLISNQPIHFEWLCSILLLLLPLRLFPSSGDRRTSFEFLAFSLSCPIRSPSPYFPDTFFMSLWKWFSVFPTPVYLALVYSAYTIILLSTSSYFLLLTLPYHCNLLRSPRLSSFSLVPLLLNLPRFVSDLNCVRDSTPPPQPHHLIHTWSHFLYFRCWTILQCWSFRWSFNLLQLHGLS